MKRSVVFLGLFLAAAVSAKEWTEGDMVIVEVDNDDRRSARQLVDFRLVPSAAAVANGAEDGDVFSAASILLRPPVRGGSNGAENQPCQTNDGRSGRCLKVNDCYPTSKLFKFDDTEQWAMGSYDSCKYYGPTRSHIFGVCCPDPDSVPTKTPHRQLKDEDGAEEDNFPVEAQVNVNCGRRFVSSRIVNGQETVRHELPFMAALMNKNRQFCGGSLIDSTHVLTAAHCVHHMSDYDVGNMRIVLGDHDLKNDFDTFAATHAVKRVIRHRNFNSVSLENDLAVVTLNRPVQFRREIQPICIERSLHDYTDTTVNVAGWGSTYEGSATSPRLRKTDVRIWNNAQCKASYGLSATVTQDMICASTPEERKDSCSGDSGGPLFFCDQTCVQLGIVSYGIGCAEPRYPGVYSHVAKFQDWIDRIVRKY